MAHGKEVTAMEKTLRRLMQESYGALAWLQGLVQLSDRARAYKIKKLQEALAAAEACLLTGEISISSKEIYEALDELEWPE
jgi:hypothetical protein